MSRLPVKLFVFLLIVTTLLLIGDKTGTIFPVRKNVENVTIPISTAFYGFSQRIVWLLTPFTSKWRDEQEIEEFRRERISVATLSARLKFLELENQALRIQLGVRDNVAEKLVMAHPIGFERYLVIDKGEIDGLRIGNNVILGDVLVGKIISVTPKMSSVILPTDPESEIPVWTPRLSRGNVKGLFGKTMRLDNVLQGELLSNGEPVLTTGEKGYLQNLVVAKVGKVESEPRDVFKTAELEPLIELRKLTVVFVVVSR